MWACVHRYLLVSGVATREPSNRAITGSIPGDDRFCASMKFSARETATGNRTRALAPVSQKRCHQTTIGIYLFFSQNPHQDLLIGKVTYDRANTVPRKKKDHYEVPLYHCTTDQDYLDLMSN